MDGVGAELLDQLGEMSVLTSQIMRTIGDAMGRLLWADIERIPPSKRLAFIKRETKYHTFGVFQAALRGARTSANRHPQDAVEIANLAVALAELADPEVGLADELRFDWRANALLALSYAQKMAGEFRTAESSLDLADIYLTCGTQDPIERAMLIVGQGGLYSDLGRFEEAVEILDRAFALFRRVEDPTGAGKVRLQQGAVLQYIDPARGLELVEEGLAMIDLEVEPRVEWAGRHTQAYCYNELGEPEEAEGILQTYRYLSDRFPDFEVQSTRNWLCARVCARLGRTNEAEHRFREVQASYLEQSFRQEAVLASIDLAELLVNEQRIGEALYIARELFPILKAWGLHRDTLALMTIVTEALERGAVEGVFREVTVQLRRRWYLNDAA
jgi:tetratricopeptide (TPR) repeat protein